MNVLEIVLPVLVMIVVGMLCRKWKILTRDGINNMKVLVTNVMLPVAIFHALATAEYNKETGILIAVDEILEDKRMRHIQTFIESHPDALKMPCEEDEAFTPKVVTPQADCCR